MRTTNDGIKFESTGRILGRYVVEGAPVFLLGEMWGCIKEDGTGIWFIRPVNELTPRERAELADHEIAMWQRFKENASG